MPADSHPRTPDSSRCRHDVTAPLVPRSAHLRTDRVTEVELIDATTGDSVRRTARLLFTDQYGRPFHDRRWSEHWTPWRKAAGWPDDGGTFHALRHFCATTMLTNHVDPQHVQKMLRHASLQVTLATYVHWLPRAERPRSVVSTVLRAATRDRASSGLKI
ncbi:MAG TPA: hypothetical protein DGG94_02200 [Micromonosporaceae bacterium]|nr:hypothetical protein [Micromonosporaceae bacterium]